ncbi:hybrid sensor histidine kinase/response regulator (plasmid) [Azospirillum sp. TSH58]|uniref:PAS domain-containing protein n=1 Tax=Azospirillum sp. TSH58 TaxID=664962 RepID=UPI000D5FE492|nr:PAS domain-containing protein [Azospirillum sp. TSH58]AWJ85967.1 hybrid sensor histidine kinase/response regulator [Azospirillum sp. TSH58]
MTELPVIGGPVIGGRTIGGDLDFLSGGGEMGERMRSHDWASTALGPPESWPQSLRTIVGVVLSSRQAMFVAWGPELSFLYNDGYTPIFGAKHPEALGRPFAEVWWDIWPQIKPLVDRTLAGEASWYEDLLIPMERRGFREDAWFTFSYTPVRGEDGRIPGMFCAAIETTSQVLAARRADFHLKLEARLRQLSDPFAVAAAAEEALGRHLGASRVGYGVMDETARFFTTERNWTDGSVEHQAGTHDLLSFGPELLDTLRSGGTLTIHDTAADPRFATPDRQAAFAAMNIASAVTASLVKNGRMVAALYVHDGKPRRWHPDEVRLVEEVAERTWSALERARAEESLHRANARLAAEGEQMRNLFRQSPNFMCVLRGPDHVFELANDSYRQLVGDRALIGKMVHEAMPEVAGQGFFELLGRVYDSGEPFVGHALPVRVVRQPGAPVQERFITFIYQPIKDADGRVTGIFCEGSDVTEAKRAEDALRDLNATLEQRVAERTADRDRIWRLSTDVMLVARFDGSISAVNPAWTSLLGWSEEELAAHSFFDFVHPDDLERTRAEAARLGAGHTTPRFENRYRHKDGRYLWLSWVAVPDDRFIHAVGRDITAQKEADAALRQTEEQLRQAQKMEAVGQLTGGVAHDFNNLLQALEGCLSMIGRRTEEPQVHALLDAGQQAVGRGAKLVQQLMAFARRDSLRPESIGVRDRVVAMSALLERALRADIALDLRLGDDLWPVEVDPTQFELAVINLAVNARDAMPAGGRLTVEAVNTLFPPGDPRGVEGEFLRLSVSDTGCGMPAAVAARAFEPFFTTKDLGKGTGLGLAQVYGLARQAGGTAWIDSAPDQGTTVHLLLRRSGVAPAEEPAPPAACAPPPGGARRHGRVLVVEDDPIVAMTVSTALEDAGFAVLSAANAEEALPHLSDDGVDVLLSDVVMPGGMSGIDLAREARARRPGLPVILATGYSEDIARATGIPVLAKPYRIDDLVGRIDAILMGEVGE